MGWLFGRKKAVPKVPFPEGKPYDEKALRFPTSSSQDRIIEPESVKAAVGFDKPVAFPEEEPMMEDQLPAPPIFPFSRTSRPMPTPEFMPRQELYVKVDVYQRMLGELDELKKKLWELSETSKSLEVSEYNEEANFNKLRKSMKSLHDSLLHADKTLFKAQGD
ncbi:MAG TPA: hypothetical protein VJA18_01360 [Candidatus Nanoarchaeia archaeon]|nr:hypothetical protein [Candidatus Nanoarchaeia archaeon]